MADFFASGRVADLIVLVLVLVLEGVALGLYHRWTGRGIALRAVLPFLLAGASCARAARGERAMRAAAKIMERMRGGLLRVGRGKSQAGHLG